MKTRSVLALLTGGSLLLLYLQFLWFYLSYRVFLPLNAFEAGLILFQASKLIAIIAAGRARSIKFVLIFDIFSAEILALPVILLLFLGTGFEFFPRFATAIYFSWPVSVALVLSPLAIYKGTLSMVNSGSLSTVLPMTFVESGLLLLFAEVAQSPNSGFSGTSGFTGALLGVVLRQSVGLASLPSGTLGSIALVIIYACMLLYAGYEPGPAHANPNLVLVLLTLSSLVVLGWAVLLSFFAAAISLFLVPTLAATFISWWFGRER